MNNYVNLIVIGPMQCERLKIYPSEKNSVSTSIAKSALLFKIISKNQKNSQRSNHVSRFTSIITIRVMKDN